MTSVTEEFSLLRDWIGRSETVTDEVTVHPIAALSATLDREDPEPGKGDPIPPLAHWLYFPGAERQSRLGEDGHPPRGGFLPPVPLPRRMFAGSSVEFLHPVRIGDRVERVSKILAVTHKEGRDGPLVFVTVRHQVIAEGVLALTEEQNIVYREAAKVGAAATPETPGTTMARAAQRRTTVTADEVMLFRFSALTFNSHRIHYDHRYATQGGRLSGPGRTWPSGGDSAGRSGARKCSKRDTSQLCFPCTGTPFCGRSVCGLRQPGREVH